MINYTITLIISSVGGTSAGIELLKLSIKAFSLVQKSIPDSQIILVGGPRYQDKSLALPEKTVFMDYVPDLYEYFAACDLAIVQGGGTTTLELTALKKPFIYFPLEGHFEQEVFVKGRLKRHGAGHEMKYSETTPEILAETMLEKLKCKNNAPFLNIDGKGAQ